MITLATLAKFDFNNPIIVILLLLAFFGVIALIVFILRKHLPYFKDDDKPLSEEEAAKEALDRILVPIEKETLEEEQLNVENKDEQTK